MIPGRLLLLMLMVLFISDDTVMFGTNINQAYVVIRYIVYVLAIIGLVLYPATSPSIEGAPKYTIYIAAIMLVSFGLTMGMNGDVRPGYFLEMIVLVLAGMISIRVKRDDFLPAFNLVLLYIASFSIAVFVLTIVARPVLSIFPVTENYANVEFSNLLLTVVFRDTEVLRNTGIFREPGVFSLYLLTGLMIELYFFKQQRYLYTGVYLVALITTMSTTGFLVATLLLAGHVLRKNIRSAAIISSITLILTLGILSQWPDMLGAIFSKFDEDSSDFASALARLSSISVPFLIFLSSPAFGSGLSNFVDRYLVFSEQIFGFPISPEGSSTNTIINIFAIFGLVMGLLTLTGLFRFSWMLTSNYLVRLVALVSLIMMFSSQELRFSLFFNCLIMYGLFSSKSLVVERR